MRHHLLRAVAEHCSQSSLACRRVPIADVFNREIAWLIALFKFNEVYPDGYAEEQRTFVPNVIHSFRTIRCAAAMNALAKVNRHWDLASVYSRFHIVPCVDLYPFQSVSLLIGTRSYGMPFKTRKPSSGYDRKSPKIPLLISCTTERPFIPRYGPSASPACTTAVKSPQPSKAPLH